MESGSPRSWKWSVRECFDVPKQSHYSVGDVVFWGTPTTAGEYSFIGHPKGAKDGKVLVLAHSGEIGVKIDADECSPTGRSDPQRGREYRQRYFRNHPRGLESNPLGPSCNNRLSSLLAASCD
jgi:hypothetical protein